MTPGPLEDLDLRVCAGCEDDMAVEGGDLCAACKARGGKMSEWNAERIAALLEPLTGYTPGPWSAHDERGDWGLPGRHVVSADGVEVAQVDYVTPYCAGSTRKERDAAAIAGRNVRLIAAAPDLVDALRAVAAERDTALAKARNASERAAVAYEAMVSAQREADAALAEVAGLRADVASLSASLSGEVTESERLRAEVVRLRAAAARAREG